MTGLRCLVATAAMLVFAGSAAAQDTEIGSRLRPRQTMAVERDHGTAMQIAHGAYGCAVVKSPAAARAYLASGSPDEAARNLHRMFAGELSCSAIAGQADLSTDSRINPSEDVSRGLTAEALLSHMAKPDLQPEPLQHVYHAGWSAVSSRSPVIDDMAMCVAATNPLGSEKLLATYPVSASEATAIGELGPTLGQCLVANAKLSANRDGVRAALAEALYHRIVDQPVNPGQTAARPAPVGK